MSSDGISMCLSGGGFRAALFHLGLIKALRAHADAEGRTALSCVSEIYSVSGGSIIAAHLIKNWIEYNGNDDEFAQLEQKVMAFARRNVRDRILRRWLFTRWLGKRRTYWLQREYKKLLGGGTIGDCYRGGSKIPPKLYVLSTSFKTGELCSFDKDNFEIVRRTDAGLRVIDTPGEHLPLAFAVAASSAFPPMFPAIPLSPEMLGNPDSDEFLTPIYLSDGGVFDNLGFEKLKMNEEREPRTGLIIVSNAGGSFRTDLANRFVSMLSRNVRASDILMRRVGDSTEASARQMGAERYVAVKINTTAEDDGIDEATQIRLRAVRTDLDTFDKDIAGLLIDHGYRVAAAALAAKGWIATVPPPRLIADRNRSEIDAVASNAARRKRRSLFFDFRDWKTTPIFLSIVIAVPVAAIAGAVLGYKAWERVYTNGNNTKTLIGKVDDVKTAFVENNREGMRKAIAELIKSIDATRDDPDLLLPSGGIPVSNSDAAKITAPAPDYSLPKLPQSRPQKVYIQFAGDISRTQIIALNRSLRAALWNPQGTSGERTAVAAGQNEIRYAPSNIDAARELATAIQASGISGEKIGLRAVASVKDTLEVWISR